MPGNIKCYVYDKKGVHVFVRNITNNALASRELLSKGVRHFPVIECGDKIIDGINTRAIEEMIIEVYF